MESCSVSGWSCDRGDPEGREGASAGSYSRTTAARPPRRTTAPLLSASANTSETLPPRRSRTRPSSAALRGWYALGTRTRAVFMRRHVNEGGRACLGLARRFWTVGMPRQAGSPTSGEERRDHPDGSIRPFPWWHESSSSPALSYPRVAPSARHVAHAFSLFVKLAMQAELAPV